MQQVLKLEQSEHSFFPTSAKVKQCYCKYDDKETHKETEKTTIFQRSYYIVILSEVHLHSEEILQSAYIAIQLFLSCNILQKC